MPRTKSAILETIIKREMPGFRIVKMPKSDIGFTASVPGADNAALGQTETDLVKLQAKYGIQKRRGKRRTANPPQEDHVAVLVEPIGAKSKNAIMSPQTVIISLKSKTIVGAQG